MRIIMHSLMPSFWRGMVGFSRLIYTWYTQFYAILVPVAVGGMDNQLKKVCTIKDPSLNFLLYYYCSWQLILLLLYISAPPVLIYTVMYYYCVVTMPHSRSFALDIPFPSSQLQWCSGHPPLSYLHLPVERSTEEAALTSSGADLVVQWSQSVQSLLLTLLQLLK